MTVLEQASGLRDAAALLLDTVERHQDSIDLADAHEIYRIIRETEGWLVSARRALEP